MPTIAIGSCARRSSSRRRRRVLRRSTVTLSRYSRSFASSDIRRLLHLLVDQGKDLVIGERPDLPHALPFLVRALGGENPHRRAQARAPPFASLLVGADRRDE